MTPTLVFDIETIPDTDGIAKLNNLPSGTPAADIAIRRYLDEGAKIARDITARYAN